MSPILGSVGGVSEYSFRGNLDDVPNSIILQNLTDVEPGSVGVATTTITGLNYKALATVTGGAEFSVNAGSYTTLPKSIENNQTLSVRFTTTSGTDADFSKAYNTTVSVGKRKSTWAVTTRAKDTTPTSFSFTSSTGQNVGVTTLSNIITISGLETSPQTFAFISSGIGSFHVNGVTGFTTAQVGNGTTIRIQATSPVSYATTSIIGFTVGTFTTTFTVSTRAADRTVDAFSFTSVTNAGIGTTVTSNTITISGADNNVALASTISGSSGQVSVNSGTYVSGTTNIFNGNTVSVRIPSTAIVAYGTTYRTTLNVAGVSTTFSVTTRPRPITSYPNQFTFTDLTSASPQTVVESNQVTLQGITSGTFGVASISGAGEFRVIRNNSVIRNYGITTSLVAANDQIQLRLTSPNELETAQTTFTVSGQNTNNLPGVDVSVSDIWSVTSRQIVCSPLSASSFFFTNRFADISSAELNTYYNTLVDFTGFDSRCNFFITTSDPDSYIQNPYTGETGQTVAVPTIPSSGIKVWMKSSSSFNTYKPTTVSIYNTRNPSSILTRTWAITTKQVDATPDDFEIPWISGADPFATVSSNAILSLSGISQDTSVSASIAPNPDYPESSSANFLISKNNGPFVTSIDGGVTNGDRIDVKATAGNFGQVVQAIVRVGTLTKPWRVTSDPAPPVIIFDGSPGEEIKPYTLTSTLNNTESTYTFNRNLPYNQTILFYYRTKYLEISDSTNSFTLTLPYYDEKSSNTVNLFDISYFKDALSPSQGPNYNGGNQFFKLTSNNQYGFPYGPIFLEYKYAGGLPQNEDGTTNVEFLFTAKNVTGTTTSRVIAKIDPPPPTASISITPSGTIPYDGQYTVNWTSTYGASVSSSTNLGNTTSLNGSFTVTNAKESKIHSITIRNATETATTSITANVAACAPTTTETDSAVYTYAKVIYSNGAESEFDYYLTSIKDNTTTNVILEYPNRTSEYSEHKLKTVLYTIASTFKEKLGRPPTLTEVGEWLSVYNKGISKPYSFTFTASRNSQIFSSALVFLNTVYSGTSQGNYSFEIPVIVNGTTESFSFDRSIIIGSSYTIFPSSGFISRLTNKRSQASLKTLRYDIDGNLDYNDMVITLSNSGDLSFTTCFFTESTTANPRFIIPVSSLTGLTTQIKNNYTTPAVSISRVIDTCGTTLPTVNDPGA